MNSLGTIYTLEEAAEKLRLEKRTVAKIARKNGLCSLAGREYRFSEKDIIAIWDVIRCPLQSSPVETSGISVARFTAKKSTNLRDFAMRQAQKKSEDRRKNG
jgi:excisionase family DNA binding protein